ncbi:MAG: PA14 domain-containing protein [Saprospiraceae bacterium]
MTGALRTNNFSARYTTNFKAQTDGKISFEIEGDDGYRFFINDQKVLNAWQRNRWGPKVYKTADNLPDFRSYDMSNRTYRYFKGEALYPYGNQKTKQPSALAAGSRMLDGKRVAMFCKSNSKLNKYCQ